MTFGLQNIRRKGAATAAVLGLGALLVGCSTSRDLSDQSAYARLQPRASYGDTLSAAAPMAVACEPNQRAVIRQSAVNGIAQPQVQCETVNGAIAPVPTMGGYAGAMPVNYQPAYGYSQPIVEQPRVVRTVYPQREVVTAAPRRVVYQPASERPVYRKTRSVKQSAIIIGSSAGIGAGVGAAVGGKKGAGIGALIGGGGAALWDQITRHKQ